MLIKDVLQHTVETFTAGTLLKGRPDVVPLYKKRIGGRGGYRLYFTLIVNGESVYLLYVDPKTGSRAASMMEPTYYNELETQLADALENNRLYRLEAEDDQLKFIPPETFEES